jgi:hypothetical protein
MLCRSRRTPANYKDLNVEWRPSSSTSFKLNHNPDAIPTPASPRYPPSHPSYAHPSLLNSIYLLSAFFLSAPSHPSRIQSQLKWNVQEAEYTLLKRVRTAMIEGVKDFSEQGVEVLDFILALGLVARYFYCTGQYITRAAVRRNLHYPTLNNSNFFVNSCDAFSNGMRPQPHPFGRLNRLR